MRLNSFWKFFFKKFKKDDKLKLENFVELGLLTQEEVLRIKKDRAIELWHRETKSRKK